MVKNNYPSPDPLQGAIDAFEVAPSNDDLREVPRALYIGSAGDVVVRLASGDITFTNVPGGTILAVRPTRVLPATSASDIVALV